MCFNIFHRNSGKGGDYKTVSYRGEGEDARLGLRLS
jgi:hypothetical protein